MRQKMVFMAHRLHKNEDQIKNQRHQTGKPQLRIRVAWPRRGGGELRQNQRQRGQRRQHGERGATAFSTKANDAMANATSQQTNADHTVADDHHRGKNSIPRQAARFVAAREHHRDDQGNFDHGDRQRQNQRAQRFADAVRNNLGVINGDQDGGDQGQRYQAQKQRTSTAPQAG